MAAVEFEGGCAHALGHGALQIGMHGVIFFADDVPGGLRFPGGSSGLCVKQVGFRNPLGRPNELLLGNRPIDVSVSLRGLGVFGAV